MSRRAKNKAEKRRRHQICKALDLCLQINGLQKRQREYTGNQPTVFFDFSGHTAEVNMYVHTSGWHDTKPDIKLRAYLTEPGQLDKFICQAEEWKKDLNRGNCNRSRK